MPSMTLEEFCKLYPNVIDDDDEILSVESSDGQTVTLAATPSGLKKIIIEKY